MMQAQYASTGFFSGWNGAAASAPSLTPMRWPLPAPSWSRITKSSPSGAALFFRALRLKGTAMIQRKLASAGWARDSVTVPITSAMRMAVQLREGTGHAGRARRLAGLTYDPHNLPDLEERPDRHLHDQQVGDEGQRRPRRRADGIGGDGPQSGDLVGHAADQAGVLAEDHAALTLAAGHALRHRPRPAAGRLAAGGCQILPGQPLPPQALHRTADQGYGRSCEYPQAAACAAFTASGV